MKKAIIFLALIIIVVAGAISFKVWPGKILDQILREKNVATVLESFPSILKPDQATIIFVGDMMFDRSVKASVVKNYGGDYQSFLSGIKAVSEADLTFGNLEGPVSDRGNKVGSIYSFRFDPSVLPALKAAGFDVLSMANNHIGDYAYPALADTVTLMMKNGILPVGGGLNKTDALLPRITKVNNLKICWFGASEFRPSWQAPTETRAGINDVTDPVFYQTITNYKTQCDFIIASFHFGTEYLAFHNDFQEKYAKKAIDAGANLVVGHHPHVPEDVVTYKNGLIAYSLGNFIFDQYFSTSTMNGLVLKVTVGKNKIIDYATTTSHQDKTYKTSVQFD